MTDLEIGSELLVFRKSGNTWEGPYQVLDVSGKILNLFIDGNTKRFSIDKVKKFRRDDQQKSGNDTAAPTSTPTRADVEAMDRAIGNQKVQRTQ